MPHKSQIEGGVGSEYVVHWEEIFAIPTQKATWEVKWEAEKIIFHHEEAFVTRG